MVNFLHAILLFLRPLGFVYALIMRLRSWAYEKGVLKTFSPTIPVISVGNLTMGGGGKTPLVIYLSKLLQKHGFKPAVVSRGYKGKAGKKVNLVSDGSTIYLDADDAGDEPLFMAEVLHGIPVLTGKQRSLPCKYAEEHLHCNIIILDDGFQHLAVKRDLDLVLFNSTRLNKFYNVFPGGILRESYQALKRAHCIVYTNMNDHSISSVKAFENHIKPHLLPDNRFSMKYEPVCFVDLQRNRLPISEIKGRIGAFCGIASPDRFERTLKTLGLDVGFIEKFQDHHIYSAGDIDQMESKALSARAELLVTTEKDLVKLKSLQGKITIMALAMEVVADESFNKFILTSSKRKKTSKT